MMTKKVTTRGVRVMTTITPILEGDIRRHRISDDLGDGVRGDGRSRDVSVM